MSTMKNSTRNLARYETALDILNMMVAGLSADIATEEAGHRPSEVAIAKMARDQRDYRRAALALNPDDADAIEEVIKVYGPLQRSKRAQRAAVIGAESGKRTSAARAG
ncbi:MAG: hypothetical protein J0L91_00170 [Burkholderiales bacterium]|nr:hypothetical protein [Burkholderiales bacterium]